MIRLPIAVLDATIERLDIRLKKERDETMNQLARANNASVGQSNNLTAFANAVLSNAVSKILSAPSREGHTQTLKSANNVGRYVGINLSFKSAETALVIASMQRGKKSQYEATRVVRNGLNYGMNEPFDYSTLESNQKENKQAVDTKFIADKQELKAPVIEPIVIPEPTYIKNLSWVKTEHLPIAWLRAILTLSGSSSAVARLAIRLHTAFKTGAIESHCFTIKEVYQTLDLPEKSTTASFKTLLKWGFMSVNDTYSTIYTMQNKPTKNLKGGRPAKTYSIINHTEQTIDNRNPVQTSDVINLSLLSRLEYYVMERHTDKSLAPRLHTLTQDLDLPLEDAEKWHDRINGQVDSEVAYKIGRDFRNWSDLLLGEKWHKTIDYADDIDNAGLRALILSDHISKYKDGIQMSQDELQVLLGLKSATSLKSIYQLSDIMSVNIDKYHMIDNPNTCNVKQELKNATRAKNKLNDGRGGRLIWVEVRKMNTKKWTRLNRVDIADAWQSLQSGDEGKPVIQDVKIKVQLPSLIKFKTDDDKRLEQLAASEKAKQEAKEDIVGMTHNEPPPSVIEPTLPTEKPKRRKSYSTKQDRTWDKHDKQWIHKQLQIEVYCWLNQDLKDTGQVFGRDGLVTKLSGASDIIRYINQQVTLHNVDKPFHSIEKFFDSDVLDFGIESVDVVLAKTPEPIETPTPAPTVRKIIAKRKISDMTIFEMRELAKSIDRPAYFESIGVK